MQKLVSVWDLTDDEIDALAAARQTSEPAHAAELLRFKKWRKAHPGVRGFADLDDSLDDETWSQIQLAGVDGTTRTVTAQIVGPFGLHPGPGESWHVTHVRSGRDCGDMPTWATALLYARVLDALPIAWEAEEPDAWPYLEAIAALRQRLIPTPKERL
jgi:hypothetical protein